MADYLIKGETLTDIADAIRDKTGDTEDILVKDMASAIGDISTGTDTSDATATAEDIVSGKTAYVDGKKVTGNISPVAQATPSISINSSGLITASVTQTAGYVTAGTKSATKQLAFQAAKTITPGTTNQIAVSSGYYTGGSVTVKGDSNLVASNIKSGVSIFGVTGTLTTGGSSGSGDTDIEDSLITRTITECINDRVSTIGSYTFAYCTALTTASFLACTDISNNAFYRCSSLTDISFPACTRVGASAFRSCAELTTVSFPKCTSIGSYAFDSCAKLTTVSFPKCTTIGSYAFGNCTSLTTVSFPVCTTIGVGAFGICTSLTKIYIKTSTVCKLSNSNAFTGTKITSSTGYIYVPASLSASYKTASNWSYFSNRIYGS